MLVRGLQAGRRVCTARAGSGVLVAGSGVVAWPFVLVSLSTSKVGGWLPPHFGVPSLPIARTTAVSRNVASGKVGEPYCMGLQ